MKFVLVYNFYILRKGQSISHFPINFWLKEKINKQTTHHTHSYLAIKMTEDIPLDQCKAFINENYVDKLLKFLRGESKRVTTNVEYMKVYQLIIY